MKNKRELAAPCGLDCFNCQVYEENITGETASMLSRALGIEKDRVSCGGCRRQKGARLSFPSCETFDCAEGRGHEFCFECRDFPCHRLQPASDGADKYPHNMKLFNLCRMRLVGVDEWAEKEAAIIRERYFRGKFVVGKGPLLD